MEQMRHQNRGLRKICGCQRRKWAKCGHSWHFNFKAKGGPSFRFSVDSEAGKHIEGKGEAEALADVWRSSIRAGTFRRQGQQVNTSVHVVIDAVTLEKFGDTYADRLGKPVSANHNACFKQFCAFVAPNTTTPYCARPLSAFTEDDIEAFFAHLRAKGIAQSTLNKYVQIVKALFRWATKKGYLTRNPAADSDVLKRGKHAQRHRRLEPGEEDKLLAHAGAHLQRLIIGALETGARRGELLNLTWRDVNLDRREMTIRGETSKTRTGRVILISARLAATLQMARTNPAGDDFGAEAFVFGDAIGEQVKDIKRAWETCVLKAHGHAPAWTRDHALSAPSREALRAIDLTFHDLRHEAGSRLLEAGRPLHNVAHMHGHANIAQTSTYLNATKVGLQDAMRRLDASRCNLVASEEETDRAPLRNDGKPGVAQPLIN